MIVAAEDRALSLEEAVDRALQQAPQVAASAAGLDAAVARAPSAGRLPDPSSSAAWTTCRSIRPSASRSPVTS